MSSTITPITFSNISTTQLSQSAQTTELSNASQSPKAPQNQTDNASAAISNGKDKVQFSQEAMTLSRGLQEKSNPIKYPDAKSKDAASGSLEEAKKVKEYFASKSFPPFIGNTTELKQLKQASPSLYREVLKMIVPPPLDISYYDAQILKGSKSTIQQAKDSN